MHFESGWITITNCVHIFFFHMYSQLAFLTARFCLFVFLIRCNNVALNIQKFFHRQEAAQLENFWILCYFLDLPQSLICIYFDRLVLSLFTIAPCFSSETRVDSFLRNASR